MGSKQARLTTTKSVLVLLQRTSGLKNTQQPTEIIIHIYGLNCLPVFGNGNVKKTISLMIKTTTLHVHHAFLYISLPSLHNYNVT